MSFFSVLLTIQPTVRSSKPNPRPGIATSHSHSRNFQLRGFVMTRAKTQNLRWKIPRQPNEKEDFGVFIFSLNQFPEA